MPFYRTVTIYNIQYGILKYRGSMPEPSMPSRKLFHINNLLNKDKMDGDLDPWASTRNTKPTE